MNYQFNTEISAVGGDPIDEVWIWLATRGPHGNSFTWAQSRQEPPGYVGFEHLMRVVDELSTTTPDFQQRARCAALAAMTSTWAPLVRRGIQVLALVGSKQDLSKVTALVSSPDAAVAGDAKACAFHLKRRRAV
jgi:hypothetical protein